MTVGTPVMKSLYSITLERSELNAVYESRSNASQLRRIWRTTTPKLEVVDLTVWVEATKVGAMTICLWLVTVTLWDAIAVMSSWTNS